MARAIELHKGCQDDLEGVGGGGIVGHRPGGGGRHTNGHGARQGNSLEFVLVVLERPLLAMFLSSHRGRGTMEKAASVRSLAEERAVSHSVASGPKTNTKP